MLVKRENKQNKNNQQILRGNKYIDDNGNPRIEGKQRKKNRKILVEDQNNEDS